MKTFLKIIRLALIGLVLSACNNAQKGTDSTHEENTGNGANMPSDTSEVISPGTDSTHN